MKFKTIQLFVCGVAISLFNIGCSSEMETKPENPAVTTMLGSTKKIALKEASKEKLKKETSLLIGRILSKKEVRDEVLTRMKEVSVDGEAVSFGYLLGKNKGVKKNEIEKLASKKAKPINLFSQSLDKELVDHKNDYVTILELIVSLKTPSSISRVAVEPDPFTDANLQLYSPYNEVNGYSATAYEKYYTSEEKEDGSLTNSGYYFNGVSESYVSSMNNDFIDTHPSFIVAAIDNEDLVGGVSTTIELFATGTPLVTAGGVLLINNVNHNSIPDKDIVSTRIPMIRINGNNWMGFGATHQKVKIFRASTSWYSSILDGTVKISGSPYKIGREFKTKRRNVRKKNWLTFDQIFDDNWKQSENSEQLAIFSIHNFAQSKRPILNVKYGLIINNTLGIAECTPFATGSAVVQIECYESEFRGNTELFRNEVLSTIVGAGTTGKTYNDGGVEYNVKSTGIVDYYFKHTYTKL